MRAKNSRINWCKNKENVVNEMELVGADNTKRVGVARYLVNNALVSAEPTTVILKFEGACLMMFKKIWSPPLREVPKLLWAIIKRLMGVTVDTILYD